jgi:hypothetical protein
MRLFMSRDVVRVATRKSRVFILRIGLTERYCSKREQNMPGSVFCQVFFIELYLPIGQTTGEIAMFVAVIKILR